MPYFKVTALCDLSEKVIQYLGEMYRIKNLYTNYEDLVRSDEVDIVLVTNKDHAPISVAAMNAGKHVFSEKPMCFNLAEADEVIEAEKRNKVKFMVGYMKRYDPAFEYALPIIKEMDDVHLVKVHDYAGDYTINAEIYDEVKNDDLPVSVLRKLVATDEEKMLKAIGPEKKGLLGAYSTLLYLLIHDSILLQETYGKPDEVLYADVYNDTILAVLKFGEDIRCVVEGGLLLARREWDERFEVYGNKKRISVEFPFPYVKNVQTIVRINEQDDNDRKANIDKTLHVSYDEAFKREWRHFYECITEDKTPITSSEKARNDIELSINIINAVKI
jgi:predicted dehydrogenase